MQFSIEVADPRGVPAELVSPPKELEALGSGYGPLTRIRRGAMNLLFRRSPSDPEFRFWSERGVAEDESFVYLIGWCYRIGSPGRDVDDADLSRMLARHRAGQPPADEEISGNHLIVAYDAGSGALAVQPDHHAWIPAYFAAENGRIAVSNRAVLVASAVEAPFDGFSVSSLIRGVHYPFGRSLFAGVRRLLCGCWIRIDTRTPRLEVRRATPLNAPIRPIPRRDAVALVSDSVRSLARRLTAGEPTVFDLTGGMDTRLLAAGIRSENPVCVGSLFHWSIVGPEELADVRVARRVATALGWPLRRLDRVAPTDTDPSELERAALLSDGSCLVDLAFARLRLEAQEGGTWGRAGGMGGELLRGWLWGQEFFRLGRTSRVNYQALFDYRLRPSRAFEGSALGPLWPSLAEHDDVLLGPYREIGAAGGDRVNAYKLDAIAQHKLIYLSYYWVAGIRRVRLPFVSREFDRAVLSLPWHLRATRRLLLLTMKALSPELTRIPTSKGEPMKPLGVSSLPLYATRAASELRRGIPFVLSRLTHGRRRPPADPAPRLPGTWVSLVADARHVTSFVDPAFVRRICDPVAATPDTARALLSLLTLELLCRSLPGLRREVTFPAASPWI